MLAVPLHAAAVDAADVLARARAASGGERWQATQHLQAEGEQSLGGLQGRWHLSQDVRTGALTGACPGGATTAAKSACWMAPCHAAPRARSPG
ncbi:hypothetical protein G6F64_015372 [Rhizopus arrhizus]|uniref:Uncharacterized protein n=1 Tax=Rhizopus oryzae TaxID=64495 RepID=A0A9P6WRM9_RHIOR|nr:hypothetical protein G6F64_015372 [Rhizopus arrhizus]